MVQQGTVYRYPALLAVFFILFRNNRYAPDKQTINGILTVHKQSISVPHNKISNMGTRKNDKKLYILLYLIIGKKFRNNVNVPTENIITPIIAQVNKIPS